MGVVPGAVIGAVVAIFLSKQLAAGNIDLWLRKQMHSQLSQLSLLKVKENYSS